jgi:hypothetical protein
MLEADHCHLATILDCHILADNATRLLQTLAECQDTVSVAFGKPDDDQKKCGFLLLPRLWSIDGGIRIDLAR